MQIFLDSLVAFLCCAGLMMIFLAFIQPRRGANTRVLGLVISDNIGDIINLSISLKAHFNEVLVVTNADFSGILLKDIKVLSPEEFKEYVTRENYN